MGLLSGLVFGLVVGIGIMAGFSWVMKRRSLQRIHKAAWLKQLGGIAQEELKKLCGDSVPSWISFPAFERVKWLNSQLEKIWPHVAQATSAIIKDSVEPILEQYRPVVFQSIKFDKLFLGNVPPQIEGVRVQTLKPGEVIMDLDTRWGGDPSIILAIQTRVGAKLPVQLKNLKFYATVRVIFKLSDEIPCISAVVVALLAQPKPEIKYTLKLIGGSVTGVPGLSDMISDMVENLVTDTLEWPHRIVTPIGGQPVDLSDLYLKLQGCLTVTIVKATGLKNAEMIGRSDPYAVAYVRVLFKRKTKTIDDNLNPEWNETFDLDVEDHETQLLYIKVMDEDIGNDKFLGIVTYPISNLVPEETTEVTLNLKTALDTNLVKDKKDRGTVTLKLHYHNYTKEEQKRAMEEEAASVENEKLKSSGVVGQSVEAVGGAVGGAGKLLGSGVSLVGNGIGKAGRLVGKTVSAPFSGSKKSMKSPAHENGSAPPTPVATRWGLQWIACGARAMEKSTSSTTDFDR